ncbi:MAG TPA: acetate--CoA ligase family protein [Ramlibacter sp.]|nr:acetate--CoA ligase family protein [Ramlibacter sp.]
MGSLADAMPAEAAQRAAVRALLEPASIAIIGASDKSRWSINVVDNLRQGGWGGKLHLVNPRGAIAHGQQCATSCATLGERVDLGLIMAPAGAVADAVADLAAAGGRSAVILTAGFAETGVEGQALQEKLRAVASEAGVRLLGPNCLGFVNFTNRAYVWTTPVKAPSRQHGVTIVSQSGATAYFLSTLAYQQDVGLSHVISTGNEADLDSASFIDHLLDDPAARAIAIFAETFRHPQRFLRVAERALSVGKPLVVLKVGASEVTAKSAMAHTGALVGDDRVFDGLCAQYGIVRAHSMEELLATADVLSRTGVLRPGGVGVVTNSGGVGEIAADTCHLRGIALPQLEGAAEAAMRQTIPDMATAHNPIDLTGAVTPEQCAGAVRAMAAMPDCAAILCPWYDIPTSPDQVSERLTALHQHLARGLSTIDVPGLLVSYTSTIVNDMARGIVADTGADYLACGLDRALAGLAGAMKWSARVREHAQRKAVAAPQRHITNERPRSEREALDYLARQGVPVVPATVVADAPAAVAAARALGGPVVIKVASPDIAHKSDIGGVLLNLQGDDAVRAGFEQVMAAARERCPGARLDGAIVAPMRGRGIELFVGFTRDPQWGPVLAVGLGGVWVEVLQDVALRPLPVDADEARRMLAGLRGAKLLSGQRGVPAADLDAVARAIARIGEAILTLGPDLAELDVNPLWVRGDHIEALDALFVWDEQAAQATAAT